MAMQRDFCSAFNLSGEVPGHSPGGWNHGDENFPENSELTALVGGRFPLPAEPVPATTPRPTSPLTGLRLAIDRASPTTPRPTMPRPPRICRWHGLHPMEAQKCSSQCRPAWPCWFVGLPAPCILRVVRPKAARYQWAASIFVQPHSGYPAFFGAALKEYCGICSMCQMLRFDLLTEVPVAGNFDPTDYGLSAEELRALNNQTIPATPADTEGDHPRGIKRKSTEDAWEPGCRIAFCGSGEGGRGAPPPPFAFRKARCVCVCAKGRRTARHLVAAKVALAENRGGGGMGIASTKPRHSGSPGTG